MKPTVNDELLIAELFDAQKESVVRLKPYWYYNEKLQKDIITDFEVLYCNSAASEFLHTPKKNIIGSRLFSNSFLDDNSSNLIFNQSREVYESGEAKEFTYYNEHLGGYYNVLRSKVKDGVLAVSRDRTEQYHIEKELRQQAHKYNTIIDASADGILVLEAVRDGHNEIADFNITHCNNVGCHLGRLPIDAKGRRLLHILPHLKVSDQFQIHKQVVETGVPVQFETSFRTETGEEYGWFIVSLMKLEDGVLSRFVDISEKKKNEEKIENQATLLNSILNASLSSVLACEAIRNEKGEIKDLRFLQFNNKFSEFIGKIAEEIHMNTVLSLFPYSIHNGFLQSVIQVIETGDSARREVMYKDDKQVAWYDVAIVKMKDNAAVVTFGNITESKNQKQQLEESALYLQNIIDSSQTGILVVTPELNDEGNIIDFRFKNANLTVANLVNQQPAKLIGDLYSKWFPEYVNNGTFENFKTVSNSGNSIRFQSHYVTESATSWFDSQVQKAGEDLLITYHDYTPLKQLQDEIERSAERLATVINSAQAGMFTLVPVMENDEITDFTFGIVNQAVASYIGQTSEVLTGSLGSIYFPAYKLNGLFDIYKDTYLNDMPHKFDFHYQDDYDVFFNISTVKMDEELLVTFTDQTALKKLQRELEASVNELKRSNTSLQEFAYAASHDLQEPLRKIYFFSERLSQVLGKKLNDDEQRMFQRMQNATARMRILIDDLLTFSQVSATKGTFVKVDLNEVVQQSLVDLETSIAEKGASVKVEKLPVVNGNRSHLQQIFQNLLSNSLKYSKAEIAPDITIKATVVNSESDASAKAYNLIKVTDNGIGFEQQHADKIFQVFQRLHGHSEYQDTGIGLAIVQKVIENHGGFINATSEPEKGATFNLYLPA